MKFTLERTDLQSRARAGIIETGHGLIHTPVFMPVGTAGTVKGIHFRDLVNVSGAEIILGNTYHLYLRPGTDVISQAGGIHCFNGWPGTLLTDSGGYQVYSLAEKRKVRENGVTFQSHFDGSKHIFTPENVIDIQRLIGADIIMAFDECPPFPSNRNYVMKSMKLTHLWCDRCLQRFNETEPKYGYPQTLFPIVQGGIYPDLRMQSAEFISSMAADGNAIGGLSVGEPEETMYEMTELVCNIIPSDKPRYLMGVGTPSNLLESVALGIDMFDCVLPTRNGRNAMLFTIEGTINLRNEKWKYEFSPIDEAGILPAELNCSKAYLRHLFIAGEMLGPMIASLHNVTFFLWLMRQAREKILDGTFSTWKEQMARKVTRKL